jgi:hypothetical protein
VFSQQNAVAVSGVDVFDRAGFGHDFEQIAVTNLFDGVVACSNSFVRVASSTSVGTRPSKRA